MITALQEEVSDEFELLDRLMSELKEREAFILKSWMGIDLPKKTLREIGKELKIDKTRVAQLRDIAMRRLRKKALEFRKHDLLPVHENWGDGRRAGHRPIPPPEGCRWISHPQATETPRFKVNVVPDYSASDSFWNLSYKVDSSVVEGPLIGEWSGYMWRCGNHIVYEGNDRRGVLIKKATAERIGNRLVRSMHFDRGEVGEYVSFKCRKWNRIRFYQPQGKIGHSMVWMIVYRN